VWVGHSSNECRSHMSRAFRDVGNMSGSLFSRVLRQRLFALRWVRLVWRGHSCPRKKVRTVVERRFSAACGWNQINREGRSPSARILHVWLGQKPSCQGTALAAEGPHPLVALLPVMPQSLGSQIQSAAVLIPHGGHA
jgi:hypothetical protein